MFPLTSDTCIPGASHWCRAICARRSRRAELESGKDIWYYNWVVRMDSHDYIRTRLYPWQIYSADGNGGLLWNTVYFPDGTNPGMIWTRFLLAAGQRFLSTRQEGEGLVILSALRKSGSIDDFDYMRILENKIDAQFPGKGEFG